MSKLSWGLITCFLENDKIQSWCVYPEGNVLVQTITPVTVLLAV